MAKRSNGLEGFYALGIVRANVVSEIDGEVVEETEYVAEWEGPKAFAQAEYARTLWGLTPNAHGKGDPSVVRVVVTNLETGEDVRTTVVERPMDPTACADAGARVAALHADWKARTASLA